MKLLQGVIDSRASADPEGVAYIVPRSEKNVDDGFENITNWRFANAIDCAASWFKQNIKGQPDQTIAFIGPQDVRYLIFIIAANKAGHKLLLLSPRNSDDAQTHLLGVAKSQYILYGQQFEKSSRRVTDTTNGQVDVLLCPGIWHILSNDKVEPVEFTGDWNDVRRKPFVVLHTSGSSTGKPKPIILNHGYYAVEELLPKFPEVDGYGLRMTPFTKQTRICHAMPLFHVGALFSTLFKPTIQAGKSDWLCS
jgi:acyl-CoA synthetase (AMP-forming)/AMP-acid ligase II